MNFIGSPRSVWLGSRVDRSCGSFDMTARTGEASCRGFAGCGAAPHNDERSSRTPRWAGRSHKERLHLQLPKEVDHGGVDLRSAFLLGPMSAAWQHNRWPELWNECRLPGNGLLKHDDKHVAVAHNVERRNGYSRPIKGGHEFPAAIDIAPPAQGAAEPAAGEFRDINIDVGLRDPSRQ